MKRSLDLLVFGEHFSCVQEGPPLWYRTICDDEPYFKQEDPCWISYALELAKEQGFVDCYMKLGGRWLAVQDLGTDKQIVLECYL